MPENNENEPNIDPRLLRLRVELFTALQTLKGEDLKYFEDLVRDIAQCIARPLGIESELAREVKAEDRKRIEELEMLLDDLDRRGGLGHDVHERIARTLGLERLVELRTREVREQIKRRFRSE